MNCVLLTYYNTIPCTTPGTALHYTAGIGKVVLSGNVPNDKSWHGKTFNLKGYLEDLGSCTVFHVEAATPCNTPGPQPVV